MKSAYIKQPISEECCNSMVKSVSSCGFLLYYFLGDTTVNIWPDSHTRNRLICETIINDLPQPPTGKYSTIPKHELLLKKIKYCFCREICGTK